MYKIRMHVSIGYCVVVGAKQNVDRDMSICSSRSSLMILWE